MSINEAEDDFMDRLAAKARNNLCGREFRGYVFTCADKVIGDEWPCTGSAHVGPDHILCTCDCHQVPTFDEQAPASEIIWSPS